MLQELSSIHQLVKVTVLVRFPQYRSIFSPTHSLDQNLDVLFCEKLTIPREVVSLLGFRELLAVEYIDQ